MPDTWRLIGPDHQPYASDQPGTLGGHRRRRIYGRLDCPAALRAIARDGYVTQRVFFLNEEHARAAGYRPCAVCLPQAYAAWKAESSSAAVNRSSAIGGKPAMQKQQFLDRLERAWAALKESYAGLPEAQMTQPGVAGEWSIKDILAHVTTWEEESLKHAPTILDGKRPPRYSTTYGGIDTFNDRMTAKKRSMTLAEVLAQLDEVHGQFVDYIRSAPQEQFTKETRFRRRLRIDSYSHYPAHTEAIRQWREGGAAPPSTASAAG